MRHLPRPPCPARADHETVAARYTAWYLQLLPLALILGLASPSLAQIFKWTDSGGTVHFADSLHGVPPQYRDQVRSLDDRLPPPVPPPRIPLERSAQGFIVQATVDQRATLRLVLDTGATSTVLSHRAAAALALKVRHDPPVILQTANGETRAGWAEVDEIEVGGRRSGPLRVVVHDAVPGADGLLGMNYLGAFRVEIQASGPHLVLSAP